MTSIKVAIKVRPLIKRELDENLSEQWQVQDNIIYSVDPETKKRSDNNYQFDHIFSTRTTNEEVFSIVAKPIIEAVVKGINGTIFAYGQTSSGKTHTMMGNEKEPGILQRSMQHIFDCIKNTTGREFLLRVSYIEIYNERINDLLDKKGVDLKIREENGEITIKCKEEIIQNVDNVLDTMKKGDQNRRTGKTDMNEYSSRSHSIFRLTIESRDITSDSDDAVQVSQLNMVDLAGSEKASVTGADGERFKEGRHINLSLSALALVIKHLSENQDFINFRDSKLTRILQTSLGGNAMTTIICTVTPAAYDETNCTLSFASRAKKIKNKPIINEVTSDLVLLKRYKKQIDKLKQELQKVAEKNVSEEVKEMESKLEEKERMNKMLKERIERLQMSIISAESTNQDTFKMRSKRRRTWAPGCMNLWPHSRELPTILKKFPDNKPNSRLSTKSVDIMDETFNTPLTDFEVELIQQDFNPEDDMLPKVTYRPLVTFNENIETITFDSPEKHMSQGSSSPGTPKEVLRERLKYYINEYEGLREYATLERQMMLDDNHIQLRDENKRLIDQLGNVENEKCLLQRSNHSLQKKLKMKEKEAEADKNDFEYIIVDLRKQLRNKIQELELREATMNDDQQVESSKTQLTSYQEKLQQHEEIVQKLMIQLKLLQKEQGDWRASANQYETTIKSLEIEKFVLIEELNKMKDQVMKTLQNKDKVEECETSLKLILLDESDKPQENLNESNQKNVSKKDEDYKISLQLALIDEFDVYQMNSEPSDNVHTEEDLKQRLEFSEKERLYLKKMIEEYEVKITTIEAEKSTMMKKINDLISFHDNERQLVRADMENSTLTLNTSLLKYISKPIDNSILVNESCFEKTETSAIVDSVDYGSTSNNMSRSICDMTNKITELVEPSNEMTILFMQEMCKLHSIKHTLENKNSKLVLDLQTKIQESNEIKNDIHELKQGIHKLEQTIYDLTSENADLSNKLSEEKERFKDMENVLQNANDELYTRLSNLIEDKAKLENNLSIFKEQLDNLRATTPTATDDETKQKYLEYQEQIIALTTENEELSMNLMDKIEELEKVKESKALLFDHECIYKDKNEVLSHEIESIKVENATFSNQLMEKNEENENLKGSINILQKKFEVLVTQDKNASSDLDSLGEENVRLKSEMVELQIRLAQFEKENETFSERLVEVMDELEDTRCSNTSYAENNLLDVNNAEVDQESAKNLRDQVKRLTIMNKKLSELKLSLCTRCTQMKDASECRRSLKLEVKTLNTKLKDLQKKFECKCANIEVLKLKTREDLNITIMSNTFCDSFNVSTIEDKLQHLNDELETLKKNHDKFMNLYQEKCHEFDKMHDISLMEAQVLNTSDTIGKNKIDQLREDLHVLKEDLQNLMSSHANIRTVFDKFVNEKANMQQKIVDLEDVNKQLNDKITISESKVTILDSEVSNLTQEVYRLNVVEKELMNEKVILEVKLEELKNEKKALDELTASLQQSLEQMNKIESSLKSELEVAKKSKENLIVQQNDIAITLQVYKDSTVESDNKLKEINASLNNQVIKNNNLKNEVVKLQTVVENVTNNGKSNIHCDDFSAKEELEAARTRIFSEMKSLNPEIKNCSEKTVKDLIGELLCMVVQKESEIMKKLQEDYNLAKKKLKEENQQCIDEEKRTNQWAKMLEVDIEKLQTDLTKQEAKNNEQIKVIEKLQNDLKELLYENQMLKEKITVLEADFNTLQFEVERYSKTGLSPNEVLNVAQEKERIAHEIVKSKEKEISLRLKTDKELYNQRIEELTNTIETYKSKNMELRGNVEGFEANEKQLRNIIDLKTTELGMLNQKVTELKIQIEQLSEVYAQVNNENLEKDKRIDEITNLLKAKCDMLSEYKTKLENITPEYDRLQQQLKERKASIERYKHEIGDLKLENEKQLDAMKDKLLEKEIQCTILNKQLIEVNNKNTATASELIQLQEKYEELLKENDKLMKKVRNSTSNTKVEAEMEKLLDENRIVKNNLDGTTNRITELQENKFHLVKEVTELRTKYEVLQRDHMQLQKTVNLHKLKHLNADKFKEKYDELLQEKNRLVLQSEEKTLLLKQKVDNISKLKEEVTSLTAKNKELDTEMDELAKMIRDLQVENYTMEYKLQQIEIDKENETKGENCKEVENLKSKLHISEENLRVCKLKVHTLNNEVQKLYNQVKTAMQKNDILKVENEELQAKICNLEGELEPFSSNSSKSNSLAFEMNQKQQRRSNELNQKRHLKQVCNCALDCIGTDCTCVNLKKKINQLEIEIVTKNSKISTLELQIRSENLPYQNKCKELKESLIVYQNRNLELQSSLQKLQRELLDTHSRECEVCRKRKFNKRDQSTQPDKLIYMSGMSSGIIEEHLKMQKLEKDKDRYRDLCRSRTRKIKELEERLKEYEEKFDFSIVNVNI